MALKKKVAAIVTDYRRNTHADVIVGKIIEGYNQDGGAGPNLEVAALYVDQAAQRDMFLPNMLANEFGFLLADSITEALTLGGADLAVDGVVVVAEHGPYPINAQGQTLYPKRRFFEEVFRVFTQSQKAVPIFNSKHLEAGWTDAKWIYDQARTFSAPLMAGSVLPVAWRQPATLIPQNSPLVEAVQIGYSQLEAYGFHALECLQCMLERRQGGETGVAAVQCLQGDAMWEAFDQGGWPQSLLDAAMALEPYHSLGDYRALTADPASNAALYFLEYQDGTRAVVAMLNGWVFEGDGGAMIFAGRLQGQNRLASAQFTLQLTRPFGHFIGLVKAIDFMIQNGQAPWPVERTLLTTGMLDALLTSRAQGGQRLTTPQLAIGYQPVDWPFATGPQPARLYY